MRKRLSHLLLLFLFLLIVSTLLPAQLLMGDQNIESTLDSEPAGSAQVFQTIANASGTLNSLNLYVDPASTVGQATIGLYSDFGGPSTLLTQATFTPQAGAWNVVSVPPVPVASGTLYWIAILGLGNGSLYFRDAASPCVSYSSSSSALAFLPAVWTTGGAWAACTLSAYGSSGGSAVLLGDQNIEANSDSHMPGRAQAFQVTAGASGTLSAMSLYVDPLSTASQATMGLYSDNGGQPSSLLTQVTFVPQAGVWNSYSVPPVPIAAGTPYWIAVMGLGSGRFYYRDSGMGCNSVGSPPGQTSLPGSWSTGMTYGMCALSAYGTGLIGVSVSPASVSLLPGATQQFAASVTGLSNTAVTWSATGGTISSSGSYVAPSTPGTYMVTATSTANSAQSASATVTVSGSTALAASLWPSSALPATPDSGDSNPVEVGVQFTSSAAGSITALRFYKSSGNIGTHIGNLWSSSGSLLASATYTNETASGWQTVVLPQPVPIQANTTYVASYYTTAGHYSDDVNYFSTAYSASPLQVPINGGVYVYGPTSAFPTQVWNSSNYWVDVVVQYTPTLPTPIAVSVSPVTATLGAGATQQFTATVAGSTNSAVTWSATGGSVSSTGLYTAPSTPGTYTVTATSVADPTQSASATVTVNAPVAIAISPAVLSLSLGGTQQFTATVTGTTNTAVTWSASGGTISASGLFTAPAVLVGIYTVTATSVADPTKSASALVTVVGLVQPVQHSVTLNWNASTSSVVGYNVYRGAQSGGPYTMINTALDAATNYVDLSVQAGQTYYYVATAVDGSGDESVYSNEVIAAVPSP